jgi:4-hydroxymandelate oxidase
VDRHGDGVLDIAFYASDVAATFNEAVRHDASSIELSVEWDGMATIHKFARSWDWVCAEDAKQIAREKLTQDVWDFVDGGSGDESGQEVNRSALDRIRIVPRVLGVGSNQIDMSQHLGNCGTRLPVVVAPMAYQRLLHPDGELAVAKAAGAAGIPYIAPMLSSYPLESIAGVDVTLWFQLYWLRDRGLMLDLLRRSQEANCRALVITLDVPFMARRLRDLRNDFVLPETVIDCNLDATANTMMHTRTAGVSSVAAHSTMVFDPTVDWSDLDWLRENTTLPLVVKGIVDPRDAVRAAQCGADVVAVSNHGGRQLSATAPSISALPRIVEAVSGRCEVLVDSGIRTGADVLRALALGAAGVMYGRPVLWGLAADGATGVQAVLDLLGTELREALALSGCANLKAASELTVERM